MSIGGTKYNTNFYAIADTGTSLIYGDTNTINSLMSKIGAMSDGMGGFVVRQSKLSSMPSNAYF